MDIEPSSNEALKNLSKVKHILKEFIGLPLTLEYRAGLGEVLDLLDTTEEILAKGSCHE
jgi:hypothetical protein